MVRQIKFRVWEFLDPKCKKGQMAEWELIKDFMTDCFEKHESGSNILMQFTGLKDKNGKEIYENDQFLVVDDVVVETIGGYPRTEPEGITKEIKFERGAFWWGDELLDEYAQYGEVIGNAYEG